MGKPVAYDAVEIGDFALESGRVLKGARVGAARWGVAASRAERVVVLPSYYSGCALSYGPWAESGSLFDPARCCVIAFDQFGAGKSSKPSDVGSLAAWPFPSLCDCVRAQRLALCALGVDAIDMVAGWSMGGMQAFAWYALFPNVVASALAVCATPAPSAVNRVFLEGIRSVLVGTGAREGDALCAFDALPGKAKRSRLAAFGSVYAGWAYSDAFFLSGAYREFGYESPEAVVRGWAADHEAMDPADLAAQLDAWLQAKAPVAPRCSSGAPRPLAAMPSSTDRYFLSATLADAKGAFPSLEVVEIDSDLGHIAGRPGIRAAETAQIKAQVDKMFASIVPRRRPGGVP